MALRTTELIAVAVLRGDVVLQMGKDLSQRVAFKSVRETLRHELRAIANPGFPEVSDCLWGTGVHKSN